MKKKTLVFSLSIIFCLMTFIGGAFMLKTNNVNAYHSSLDNRWVASEEYDRNLTVDPENDFSIVVMGDHQSSIIDLEWLQYTTYSYNYIAQNKDAMNLKMFLNVGDNFNAVDHKFDDPELIAKETLNNVFNPTGQGEIYGANNGTNKAETVNGKSYDAYAGYYWQQLETNKKFVKILQDANVPFAFAMGNHDYEDMGYNYRINKTFNEAFPLSMYDNVKVEDINQNNKVDIEEISDSSYFGGSQYDDVENAYFYFEGNGQKYMVLVLGFQPNEDTVAWANQVVSDNKDCKVIVLTHAFLYGYPDLYEKSEYLWENFYKLHENMFMICCGHSWVSGEIRSKIDFGVNGNPIYQFLINSQSEIMGGVGVFAQLVFHKDGSVNVGYYSPAVDSDEYKDDLKFIDSTGRYFTDASQFSFSTNLQKLNISEDGEIVLGNELSDGYLWEDFDFYNPAATNFKFVRNAYSYKNVFINKHKGLTTTDEGGYIKFLIKSPENFVYKGMEFYINGELNSYGENGTKIAQFQVEVSPDNENWVEAGYFNSEIGFLDADFQINRFVKGFDDIYIKLSLKCDETSAISKFGVNTETLQTEFEEQINVDFDVNGQVWSHTYDKGFYNDLDTAFYKGSLLATGDTTDHLAGVGEFVYRFDSPEGRTIQSLYFEGVMNAENIDEDIVWTESVISAEERKAIDGVEQEVVRTGGSYSIDWKDSTLGYLVQFYYSLDGGNEFVLAKSIDNDFTEYTENINVSCDFTNEIKDSTSVLIKVKFFGIRANKTGFKTFSIDGTYSNAPVVPVAPTFELDGGTAWGTDELVVSKDGYAFDGWALNSVDGEKVDPSDYSNSDVVLYATWKKIVRITYVLGSGVNNEQNKVVALEGETITLYSPTKEGAKFVGWFDSDFNNVTQIEVGTQHIVLYASWFND